MKRRIIFLLFVGGLAFFFSCSTNVDLYCDYKDIPIVYGLIDVKADTNFIKITKAFCGNNENPIDASEVALITDSSTYPGKLKAYIMELQSTHGQPYVATGRSFELDTLTIHNKEEGIFYAPDQKLYFTTEHFNTNGDGQNYKYKLVVIKPDGDTVTASTTMVGGNLNIMCSKVLFQLAPTNAVEPLHFHTSKEAVVYEISMQFNYREQRPGQETVRKQVSWSYGAKPLSGYEKISEDVYSMSYPLNTMFNALSNAIGDDTIWDINHPNVTRYIDDFVISMSAGGHELFESCQMIQEIGNAHTTSTYSNIDGGYGLFSSRVTISRTAQLSAFTKRDIFSVKSWGFQEE